MNNEMKNRFFSFLVFGMIAMMAGCATPTTYTTSPLKKYDEHTKYRVDEKRNGFVVVVEYARYQFIPESGAVALACKNALTSIAFEHAESKKRKIHPINEQRIKISMGRNGVLGITSCSATVEAKYK